MGPTALLVGARDAYDLRRVSRRDVRSVLAWPGTYRMARKWWRTGVREMWHAASHRALVRDGRRYIPELDSSTSSPARPGSARRPWPRRRAPSTTSWSRRRRWRCTSATPRRRPRPRPWPSRGLIADRVAPRVGWTRPPRPTPRCR